jgi:nuclear transport factor 2 (NTF2) superfamily protein
MPVWLTPTEKPEKPRSCRLLSANPAECYRPAGSRDHKEKMPAEDAMEVQPLPQQEDRNPRTIEEGRALVRHVESLFMPWNIDALVDGFTEDCTVRFGTVPEFRGRTALRAFFTARSAKQKNYRLRKHLRVLADDAMTNVWDGEWQDAATGVSMKGFGVELWILRDGKIAVWETAFNVARADQAGGVAEMLG